MATHDMTLTETCPCGGSLTVAGYSSSVKMRQEAFQAQHRGHVAQAVGLDVDRVVQAVEHAYDNDGHPDDWGVQVIYIDRLQQNLREALS